MEKIQDEIVVAKNADVTDVDYQRDFQLLELALRGGGVGDVQF